MSLNNPPAEAPNDRNWTVWGAWFRKLRSFFDTDGTLGAAAGGTGINAYTVGDMLFASAVTALSKLGIGASGRWLGSSGSAPQWNAPGALTRTNDTNVTLSLDGSSTPLLAAASLTLGWNGTLAAGRLNANVVQAVSNDTNIQGSIASQTLTFSWAGTLSKARGGTGQSTYDVALLDSSLTSGRFALANAGGRLISGPAPVADGTYNVDGAAAGTVSSITTTNGLITGITTR